MASDIELVEFVVDQCDDELEVRFKRMFGEFGLYSGETFIDDVVEAPAYPGSKPYYSRHGRRSRHTPPQLTDPPLHRPGRHRPDLRGALRGALSPPGPKEPLPLPGWLPKPGGVGRRGGVRWRRAAALGVRGGFAPVTSRQRMAAAMAREVPDRPPLMCQLALGHYFLQTDADEIDIWHDTRAFARALVELQRRYAFDGILVNLPGRDPRWRSYVQGIDSDEEGNRVVRWPDGRVTVAPPDDNPHVYLDDGAAFTVSFEDVDPEGLFYVEPHDLSGVTYPYSWGFDGEPAAVGGPDFFPPWHMDTLRAVRELAGPDVSVHAELFSPFTQLMELVGYTQGLMALLIDEGKAKAVLERLAEGAACLGGLYAAEDVDAVLVSSAFVGGGFISRDHYQAFEAPYLSRVVEGVKAARPDLPVYVHTCGAIGDRLDLMEGTGVDGIDTLDPPPIGTVDLADALDALGKRVFIKGNLDPVHTVLQGTPEDVKKAALGRLELAAPGGAYVLSTACSVPPATPPENLAALIEAVEVHA